MKALLIGGKAHGQSFNDDCEQDHLVQVIPPDETSGEALWQAVQDDPSIKPPDEWCHYYRLLWRWHDYAIYLRRYGEQPFPGDVGPGEGDPK